MKERERERERGGSDGGWMEIKERKRFKWSQKAQKGELVSTHYLGQLYIPGEEVDFKIPRGLRKVFLLVPQQPSQ